MIFSDGYSSETSSHFHGLLPTVPVFFLHSPGHHPDTHRTLSRQVLQSYNHTFESYVGFCYCKNIWRVSINHLVLWGCHLEELVDKVFWNHRPVTIQMLLDPSLVDLVAMHFSRLPPEGELGPHFPWRPHSLEATKPVLVHFPLSNPLCVPTFSVVPLSLTYILSDHNKPEWMKLPVLRHRTACVTYVVYSMITSLKKRIYPLHAQVREGR